MQRVQKKALTDSMSKEQAKIEEKLRQFDKDLEANMTNSKDLQYAMKREGRSIMLNPSLTLIIIYLIITLNSNLAKYLAQPYS